MFVGLDKIYAELPERSLTWIAELGRNTRLEQAQLLVVVGRRSLDAIACRCHVHRRHEVFCAHKLVMMMRRSGIQIGILVIVECWSHVNISSIYTTVICNDPTEQNKSQE